VCDLADAVERITQRKREKENTERLAHVFSFSLFLFFSV